MTKHSGAELIPTQWDHNFYQGGLDEFRREICVLQEFGRKLATNDLRHHQWSCLLTDYKTVCVQNDALFSALRHLVLVSAADTPQKTDAIELLNALGNIGKGAKDD